MNSNIIPLQLRPHLAAFVMKEMQGEHKNFAGYQCSVIDIPKRSFIGSYLLKKIEKADYPVKDIKAFNIFADVKTVSRRRYDCKAKFYKVETMGKSFVYLPQHFVNEINDLFEEQFRLAFFHFVDARVTVMGDVTRAMLEFIEKYDLFEAGISQPQLRQLYYRMKRKGLCAALQGKLYRDR